MLELGVLLTVCPPFVADLDWDVIKGSTNNIINGVFGPLVVKDFASIQLPLIHRNLQKKKNNSSFHAYLSWTCGSSINWLIFLADGMISWPIPTVVVVVGVAGEGEKTPGKRQFLPKLRLLRNAHPVLSGPRGPLWLTAKLHGGIYLWGVFSSIH